MSVIIKADLDDIVFRPRNKAYGAYALRKEYVRNTRNALLIGVGAFCFAFVLPMIWNRLSPSKAATVPTLNDTIFFPPPPPPLDEEKIQPETPKFEPPPPPQRSQVQFVPPEVVAHDEAPADVSIRTIDSLQSQAEIGREDFIGESKGPIDFSTEGTGENNEIPELTHSGSVENEPAPDDVILVEKDAQPVNMDDLRRSLVYPEICKQLNIEGKVYVRILIGRDGKVEKHLVKKSPHALMTKEVEKNLRNLSFTPAIQSGKPVRVWQTIPFDFKLR